MIHLAFLWHFHQPSYHDPRSGLLHMPWVRLHGTKDYTGMALLLEEFPAIRCTSNFSPGMLDQLLAYGKGAEDTVLHAVRKPPESLTAEDHEFLRRQLFYAHPDRHIARLPRYAELDARVKSGAPLSTQDWLDLETLNALVWIHPLALDETILRINAKGRDYTIQDRDAVLAKHVAMLGEVIPRWKRLQDSDRVEIALSPYYHPILPLLCDFASSRRALPDIPTPPLGKSLAADAEAQVSRARTRGEELFGRAPAGCWPSEGSVSPETAALLAKAGFRWFATDQAILEKSGQIDHFKPYPVGKATAVFRDGELSNLLGFVYKTWNPADAAADFVRRVELLANSEDRLVVVALDGENAWEHYAENAVPFFRELYGRLSSHKEIRTVTVSEGIAAVAAGEPIADLWSGSWVNGNYAVWMGHEEDRRAWELLADVRSRLATSKNKDAWEFLYRAEGSDWFWWFGEDYSSPQDAEFDSLFRLHLANACAHAAVTPPEGLYQPIRRRRIEEMSRPTGGAISVTVDGRRTDYFEWNGAGRYETAREFGAMAGELSYLAGVAYGCDAKHLLLRIDFRPGIEPGLALSRVEMRVVGPSGPVTLQPLAPGVQTAVDEIFEASIPLALLGVGPGQELEFHLEIGRVRVPAAAELRAVVPASEVADWRL
jgi:alpha-amylase/alpha-mannosidase (GH57 family)